MSALPVLVFDLGKVLVDFDYGIAARRIEARSAVPAARARIFIDHSPLLYAYERGEITTRDFFQSVVQETAFQGSLEEFSSYFADIFTPIDSMVRMHAALRGAGFASFIFSNTNTLAIDHIRRSFPFFAQFDGYILSYEHGVMKPDAGLYEEVERATGHSGADLVYLDDRLENVEAGDQRGWKVIHHHSPAATFARLKSWGILPPDFPEPE